MNPLESSLQGFLEHVGVVFLVLLVGLFLVVLGSLFRRPRGSESDSAKEEPGRESVPAKDRGAGGGD